jgi:hypothetical protein
MTYRLHVIAGVVDAVSYEAGYVQQKKWNETIPCQYDGLTGYYYFTGDNIKEVVKQETGVDTFDDINQVTEEQMKKLQNWADNAAVLFHQNNKFIQDLPHAENKRSGSKPGTPADGGASPPSADRSNVKR